jgi:hypothetical protein
VVHYTCDSTLYHILRDDPDEAYHEMDVFTTGVVACASPSRADGAAITRLDSGGASWMVGLPSSLGWHSCSISLSEKKASAPDIPSTASMVVVCTCQLVSACTAQSGTGYIVVVEQTARGYAGHRLAVGTVAVAGSSSRLAGVMPSEGVARWMLAVVARATHVDCELSVSDAVPSRV